MRDALFRGFTRFGEFQRSLGVATNILSSRLESLVESGVLERRTEENLVTYWPTEKGLDFKLAIMALTAWGDRWAAPDGPPVKFHHAGCDGEALLAVECAGCGQRPGLDEVIAIPQGAGSRQRV